MGLPDLLLQFALVILEPSQFLFQNFLLFQFLDELLDFGLQIAVLYLELEQFLVQVVLLLSLVVVLLYLVSKAFDLHF